MRAMHCMKQLAMKIRSLSGRALLLSRLQRQDMQLSFTSSGLSA